MNLNEPIDYDNPDDSDAIPSPAQSRESIPSLIAGGALVVCLIILMFGATARVIMWMFGFDIN